MADPRTLLTRPMLDTADPLGWLWIVSNNTDYRIALATILGAVTADSLGLGSVDNTADADKPVSLAQQTALDLKANKDETPTLVAFNQLAASLQDYVSMPVLNQILLDLNTVISGKVDSTQLATAVTAALQPLTDALALLAARVTVIEEGNSPNLVNQTQLTESLSNLVVSFNETITNLIADQIEPLSLRLNNLAYDYADYKLNTDARLATIESGLGIHISGDVVLGPTQW